MTPITLKKDPEGGYLVTQGNLDSGCLAPDEALGIIAHALYGDGSPHRFLRPQATPPPKPCPHCGANVSEVSEYEGHYMVICRFDLGGCGACSGARESEHEALAVWNKRADGGKRIVNVMDASKVSEYINSPEGEKAFRDVVTRSFKRVCPRIFKSKECGYAGSQDSCNRTPERCRELGMPADWLLNEEHPVDVVRELLAPLVSPRFEVDHESFDRAKEQLDSWIEWKGGKCPVPLGTFVDWKIKKGDIGINRQAKELHWWHKQITDGYQIIAYRLHRAETPSDDFVSEGGEHD
jgi:hypothetical protein